MAEGYGDPNICNMARLEQVLKGIKSIQAKSSKKPTRLPITPELLRKMRQVWMRGNGSGSWDNIMLWAASLLCFFGFLRSGEITVPTDAGFDEGVHLTFNDISVDCTENPQVIRVRIKASKTDPFRVGADIFIGRTDNDLCPVAAVLAFMALRGPGPFFHFRDSKPLTRSHLVAKLKESIQAAGVNCAAYSGHSFRSGAATTAARQGIGDVTIQMLGRWKSSAYQLYIKTPREQLARSSLAGPGPSSIKLTLVWRFTGCTQGPYIPSLAGVAISSSYLQFLLLLTYCPLLIRAVIKFTYYGSKVHRGVWAGYSLAEFGQGYYSWEIIMVN